MLIGNGLISSAFKKYINDDNIIIIAAGISNSNENNDLEFERELNMINNYINEDKLIVYFSTCSLYDKSLNSKYVKHKILIEELISKNCEKYLIFRLPIVIGYSKNKNTIYNYIKNCISIGDSINIYSRATRYLIDIDDISFILCKMIDSNKYLNRTINVNFDNKMYVSEIVEIIEKSLNKYSYKNIIEDGCDYSIDNIEFLEFLQEINYTLPDDYNSKIIQKYL